MNTANEVVENVYHLKYLGAGSLTDEQVHAQAAAWIDGCYANLVALQTTAHDYDVIQTFNVTQGQPMDLSTWPTLTSGTATGTQALPLQCAALVRFPTKTAKSQGRKFVAGMTEEEHAGGGVWSSALQTALAAFAADVLAGFDIVLQDFIPGNYNSALVSFRPWIEAIVNEVVATQRRRNYGIGT
jgi:hypothetical protein